METSSITMVSIAFTTRWFRIFLVSPMSRRRGGKLKKEWMVWPPTFTAARPVGARTIAFSSELKISWRSSVVLPVPARPVRKMLRRPAMISSISGW